MHIATFGYNTSNVDVQVVVVFMSVVKVAKFET